MNAPQTPPEAAAPSQPASTISRLAAHIHHATTGERAALARLAPDAMLPHQVAALSRALVVAGLEPEKWHATTWKAWALVAHGMALAGHDGKGRLGAQLARAGVAESRVTKLLVARAEAFLQIAPRLLRLLASKQVQPNWHELSPLLLQDASPDPQVQQDLEDRRLRIAGAYFSTLASKDKS